MNLHARQRNSRHLLIALSIIVIGVAGWLLVTESYKSRETSGQLPGATDAPVKEIEFIDSTTGRAKPFTVEIARDESARALGLMYRQSMDKGRGMLFIFQDNKPRSFWMKNTVIPLDIIFIGQDFKVVAIAKHATPFSETAIPSDGLPATYVVEVNGGLTDELSIKTGDTVKLPDISQ